MNHVSIKKQTDKTIISYPLKKKEQISTTELSIIENGEILSVLAPSKTNGLFGAKLVFSVSGLPELPTCFKNGIRFLDFLGIVRQIATVIQDCEAHGIPSAHLDLEPERIFCDYKTKKVSMLYWPLISLDQYPDFSKSLLMIGKLYEKTNPGLKSGQMERYYSYLEGRGSLNIFDFIERLNLLEMEHIKESSMSGSDHLQGTCLYYKKKDLSFPLEKSPCLFGRDSDKCTWAFPEVTSISRIHASIRKDIWGKYVIEDLGSTNGTFVNKKRLKPHQPVVLQNGDRIHLSIEEFIFSSP